MIHLIIPNPAVHFLRIRCTIPVNYMWNWGREEHSGVVVKHSQRFGWQTIEMEALKWNIKSVRFKIIHYLSSCCMDQESSNGMCMAGRLEIPMLWYTSFRALFRACEREAHIWAREGGREESSDGRSYREACFLNALILNRECGGREVCQPFDATGLTPKYQVHSLNIQLMWPLVKRKHLGGRIG